MHRTWQMRDRWAYVLTWQAAFARPGPSVIGHTQWIGGLHCGWRQRHVHWSEAARQATAVADQRTEKRPYWGWTTGPPTSTRLACVAIHVGHGLDQLLPLTLTRNRDINAADCATLCTFSPDPESIASAASHSKTVWWAKKNSQWGLRVCRIILYLS